ncbi:M48 family metalloprotease [Thioflexithrix psekupsensis]|uniref:Peptidase M48 domain-containing protein n=1 Tax=Thioflexithrix psekupsensis TaxID=1570016 RepID=A0A251X4G0_9GAMM|nr:M48 family metalloprotease [Thioflexithrix psekupsensis]OUD12321.1 hypothetical protein TPSD3_14505 [Thioflexithrix psekupsensis]
MSRLKNLKNLLFFLALLFYSPLITSQAIDLPDIGLSADAILSPQDGREMGEYFLRELRKQRLLLQDVLIDDYLNSLGQYLVSFSKDQQSRFYFFTVNDQNINAFAHLGGYIGMNAGLILKTQTESELASVFAHEIAHVVQRHTVRTHEAQSKMAVPRIVAMLLAGLAASTANSDVANASAVVSQALDIQNFINYTRLHEKEADSIGMQILGDAGFDPRGMPRFFEALQSAYRYQAGEIPDFLRTHPVTVERIAEGYARADQYPPSAPREDNLLFHLMRARLLVLTTANKSLLLSQLKEALDTKNYRTEAAVHYALALTLLHLHQAKAAQIHLEWLQKHDMDRVAYQLLSIEIHRELGDMKTALAQAQSALRLHPNDQLLTLTYARLLMSVDEAQEARQILYQFRGRDKNSDYYRLLAEIHSRLNQPVSSRLNLTEFYYLNGDLETAIIQLKEAQRLTTSEDYYLSTRVDARLQQLELELKQIKEDNKNF